MPDNKNMIQENNSSSSDIARGMLNHQQQNQQQLTPVMWKSQETLEPSHIMNHGSVEPSHAINTSTGSQQKPNQLHVPFPTIFPSNGITEATGPVAPVSAPNIISAPDSVKIPGTSATDDRKVSAAKSKAEKNSKSGNEHNVADNGKTEKNRERNREHARCTRLRKKAYIQKLKDMAHGLRAVQTKEIRERRVSMQKLLNIQKVRRAVVQTVLGYHANYEKDLSKWDVLLESS